MYPQVLSGSKNSEDAGVYKLSEDLAIVQSVDFFTPVVDEPYIFGKITACNSLSDIYAMGAIPVTAMNILEFPVKELPADYIEEILAGALEILNKADTAMIGGHSVDGKELKYGMAVTGTINPKRIFTNDKAEKGDKLILTKQIGTGAIATAIKAELASEEAKNKAIEVMTTLNKNSAEIVKTFSHVHSVTDITGFGLAGHIIEMLSASGKDAEIYFDCIPFIDYAKEYIDMGLIPEGTYKNIEYFSCKVKYNSSVIDTDEFLLFDPQTSGGLLIAVKEDSAETLLSKLKENCVEANIVGTITENGKGVISVL